VAIDPKTGETIWSYREPSTGRWAYSMRADYGKGVGYGEIDGRGVVPAVVQVTKQSWVYAFNRLTGETPNRVKNNPALAGLDIGNTGTGNHVLMVVTANMLVYSDVASDGTPMLYAIDKATGEISREIEAPARSGYGMSSWVH